MGWAAWSAALVAVAASAAAAWFDARSGRIPNALCLFATFAGIGLGVWNGGLDGLLGAAAGGLVTALVPLLLYRAEAMGGGDVKLLFALGTLLGVQGGLEVESVAFMAGAVHGLVVWARRGRLKAGLAVAARKVVPFDRRPVTGEMISAAGTTIPFAPSILLGSVVAVVVAVAG